MPQMFKRSWENLLVANKIVPMPTMKSFFPPAGSSTGLLPHNHKWLSAEMTKLHKTNQLPVNYEAESPRELQ